MARGAWGGLRSTLPAATFPAWTSLVTGLNPGRHGVLDFTERIPGTYRVRFVNGSHRQAPALWTHLAAAGRRVGVLTVPATYPPEPVPGVMVSGFDTPLTTAIDGSFVSPRTLYPEIQRLVGRLPFADFQEVATTPTWHAEAIARLLDGVGKRARLAASLLARESLGLLMVVFGESDTVAHHFWRFHDPSSPRYAPSAFAHAIREVYEALDAAIGQVLAAAPADAVVAVVSDHGSGGAGDRVVHVNRHLADSGLLTFQRTNLVGRVAGHVRAAALRAVPVAWQGRVLRRAPAAAGRLEGLCRFGGIDWSNTVAYSEELDYHPSVWLNLRGREPEGTVDPAAYGAVRARIIDALEAWYDDTGRRVVERVWRREEVYHGPFVEQAPDLLLEFSLVDGYSPSCLRSAGAGPALRRLAPTEHDGGKGRGMNGAHRRHGVFLFAGPGVRPAGVLPAADIVDVLPTLLALAGEPVPAGLDGAPIGGVMTEVPRFGPELVPPPSGAPTRFSEDETRDLERRLAALGYLETDS